MKIIKGLQLQIPEYVPVRRFTPSEMAAMDMPGMGSGTKFDDNPGMPAVLVKDGRLTVNDGVCIHGGTMDSKRSENIKFVTYNGELGGIMVEGNSKYIIDRATMSLSGSCLGLGLERSGIFAYDGADVTVYDSNIYATGQRRSCFTVMKNSIFRAYDSTFICMGAPFGADAPVAEEKNHMRGLFGCTWDTARTSDMQDNSQEFFYNCTIIGDGCCCLSVDGSEGFNRVEANDCRMVTTKSGYGVYSDTFCHIVLNRCDMDIASTAGVMAGECDLTFNDCRIRSNKWIAVTHCIVSLPGQRSNLEMRNCECDSELDALSARSCNLHAVLDGCTLRPKTGVLLRSEINTGKGPHVARPAPGEEMYGIRLFLKNSVYDGDIIHEDPERDMGIYLENCRYNGAVQGVSIHFGKGSRWFATGDSEVIIDGDVDLSAIYAGEGVTVHAKAFADGGEYQLVGGGRIIVTN